MTEAKFLLALGKQIKAIRIDKEMSQSKLAEECGFEKASMCRIEAGKSNVTVLTLKKISEILEVDVSSFFE